MTQDATDVERGVERIEALVRQVKLDNLRRLAESGRVSATRTDTGDYQINRAELHRTALGRGQGRASGVSTIQGVTDVKRIETALRWLWNELDDMKDRDAWRRSEARPAAWLRRRARRG